MRIGFDATALPPHPGGAANYIIRLVRELARLDHDEEITVFTQKRGYQFLRPEKHTHSDQVEWVIVPDRTPALRLVWEQAVLPALLRSYRVDLLHSPHYTRPLSLPCRSIVTFHDMTFFLFPHLHTRLKRFIFPPMIRLSARRSDALIAVSESTRQDAIRLLKVDPHKIHTVCLGVGEEFHPIRDASVLEPIQNRYHLPPEFILYVGTVEPRKNVTVLLQAYHTLVQDLEGAPPLVIVGQKGWNYETVLRLVDSLALEERVLFTGYVSEEDLPGIFNLAKVFIYPSLYEGFGLPPLEALACGTPVITSAVSSIPEHIGEAGMLVSPGDEKILAQAMRNMLLDAGLREHYRLLGPEQAARYTWKRTAVETMKVYQNLLNP